MSNDAFDLDALMAGGQQQDEDAFDLDALLAQKQSKPSPWDRPPSTLEKVQQASTGFVSGLPGIFSGLAKELPLVANRAAQMPGQVASGLTSLVADRMSPEVQAADIKRALQKYELEKKLTAGLEATPDERWGESVGRGVARAAPQVALAAMTGGATVPVQMGLGAAAQGAQSLSEGAGGGEATLSALLAGAAPGVGKLATNYGGRLMKGAVEQYSKALHPTTRAAKVEAERIVPQLLERGVHGNLEKLAAKGTSQSDEIGQAIAGRYSTARRTVNATDLADQLESMKAPFMAQSSSGAPVVVDEAAVARIGDIQDKLREFGDAVPPKELWKYRQVLDRVVRASNGFTKELSPESAGEISLGARRALQSELTKAVPNIEKLNAEYSLWESLQHVASETALRKTGQQNAPSMLARGAGAVVGGGIGTAVGGPFGGIVGAGTGNSITKALTAAVSSPTWRTFSAVQKARLARELSSGNPQRGLDYLGRLMASAGPRAALRE